MAVLGVKGWGHGDGGEGSPSAEADHQVFVLEGSGTCVEVDAPDQFADTDPADHSVNVLMVEVAHLRGVGGFEYYCLPQPWMRAKVIVEP
jgi:hypothetical protein